MKKKLNLTARLLDKLNACYCSLFYVAAYWGNERIKLTRENCLIAAELGLDWFWFLNIFRGTYFSYELSDKVSDAYNVYTTTYNFICLYPGAYDFNRKMKRRSRFIWKKIADMLEEEGLLENE